MMSKDTFLKITAGIEAVWFQRDCLQRICKDFPQLVEFVFFQMSHFLSLSFSSSVLQGILFSAFILSTTKYVQLHAVVCSVYNVYAIVRMCACTV